jgi:hypothetical protein
MKPFLCLLLLCFLGCAHAESFRYEVKEGLNLNEFLRDGPVAAHMLLRSGHEPRFLAVFPAGDSGAGLWFEPVDGDADWVLDAAPVPETIKDEQGRTLYGFTARASLKIAALKPKQAVLSSVRFLRDYQSKAPIPDQILTAAKQQGNRLIWARDRLDGAAGYRLTIDVTDGSLSADGKINSGTDGRIGLIFSAFSGEPPLTPLSGTDLLKHPVSADALTFLSYREKFLAGSWRFDTYFGRDTLLSLRLLMPALSPEAVESGLGSVLARLSEAGEVAHEEGIGEFALVQHPGSDAPVNDYSMIDGNYMLAPVAVAYLLDDPEGHRRAADFLARNRAGAALARNLAYVLANAAPFAESPNWRHLVRFKPGRLTGQWRDSEEGNGRGVYAYDVNAVFVPAALRAASRLFESGLLDPYLDGALRGKLAKADSAAKIWSGRAPELFEMLVPARKARDAVRHYAKALGVSVPEVSNDVRFHALSLDEQGHKVPVVNSDESFALLFAEPSPAAVDQAVKTMMRPFPLGLMSEAGLVVADPVFADQAVQARFSSNAYHGTVIWSWQQALLAAGLKRQLARSDLPSAVRVQLTAAQATLWQAITATKALRSSELWTWRPEQGRTVPAPFGADAADADESNAAQLWSTVYLAVTPP